MAEVQGQAAPAASDPIAAIDAILAKENPAPPRAAQTAPDDDVAEPTGERDVEGGDAPNNEETAPPADEPTADAAADDKPAMAEIPLEQLEAVELEVTVKGEDGKDVSEKLTVKELREGYMKDKDYRKKTAEIARQREELGEQTRQAIDSERTRYIQELQIMQATLLETAAPELKNVDWNQLAASDAFEYVRLQNRANQIAQANKAIQDRINEATAKQQAEQKAATAKRATEARAKLEQAIPGWSDALYQELIKAGEPYGYKPEEVGSWLDPRSLQVLHDAYQFRQSKVVKTPPPAAKKVVIPPKTLKSGASEPNAAKRQQVNDATKRLQNSHSIKDAAALIATRIR